MNFKKHKSRTRNYIKNISSGQGHGTMEKHTLATKAPSVILINVFNKLVRDIITVVSN